MSKLRVVPWLPGAPKPPKPAAAGEQLAGLVVLLALGRVGEHAVGLGDLLEPRLGLGVARVLVRVQVARELAVDLLDLGRRRVLGDAERLVVVLLDVVLGTHRSASPLFRGRVVRVVGWSGRTRSSSDAADGKACPHRPAGACPPRPSYSSSSPTRSRSLSSDCIFVRWCGGSARVVVRRGFGFQRGGCWRPRSAGGGGVDRVGDADHRRAQQAVVVLVALPHDRRAGRGR